MAQMIMPSKIPIAAPMKKNSIIVVVHVVGAAEIDQGKNARGQEHRYDNLPGGHGLLLHNEVQDVQYNAEHQPADHL